MSQRAPFVERLDFASDHGDWAATGILGTGTCLIDGVDIGPFVVMRDMIGKIRTTYALPMDEFAVPICLQSSEVRTQILGLVQRALDEWEARSA